MATHLVHLGADVEVLLADADDEVVGAASRHLGVNLDVAERQLDGLRQQVVESNPGLPVERIGRVGRTRIPELIPENGADGGGANLLFRGLPFRKQLKMFRV